MPGLKQRIEMIPPPDGGINLTSKPRVLTELDKTIAGLKNKINILISENEKVKMNGTIYCCNKRIIKEFRDVLNLLDSEEGKGPQK